MVLGPPNVFDSLAQIKQILDNPSQALDNPSQALDNPSQILDNPSQALDNPSQILDNPSQALEYPANTRQTGPDPSRGCDLRQPWLPDATDLESSAQADVLQFSRGPSAQP